MKASRAGATSYPLTMVSRSTPQVQLPARRPSAGQATAGPRGGTGGSWTGLGLDPGSLSNCTTRRAPRPPDLHFLIPKTEAATLEPPAPSQDSQVSAGWVAGPAGEGLRRF